MISAKSIPVAKPRLPKLEALSPYIERIDAGRWYSNFGPLIQEFEARLADRFGLTPDRISTVSNATVGLALALKAVGAPAGSLCMVPSWTFSASAHAILEAGLVPCFMDVDATGLITPELVLKAIPEAPGSVGAIMPVAVWGQPIDPRPWAALASETGIPVVMDVAPGFDGAEAAGLLSVVSLHATKILGIGEGGFVMSTDPELVSEVRMRTNFGFRGSREAQAPATNGKLSEYAAAIGLAALDEWPSRRAAFRDVARRYRRTLADLPELWLPPGWGETWCSTTCVVRLPDPSLLMSVLESLHGSGVETRAWWGRGMHKQRAFANCPRLALPNTERLAETVLGLPCYIDMTVDEIDTVCDALSRRLARSSGRAA